MSEIADHVDVDELRRRLLEVQRAVSLSVLGACERESASALSRVELDAEDSGSDTIYAIDRVGEETLVSLVESALSPLAPLVLIAEGLPPEGVALPRAADRALARLRLIVDPIDGTRGLMYQKRSAWVLAGVALERGDATRLADVELAAMTEIPLVTQHLHDVLGARRGCGVVGERWNRLTGARTRLPVVPSGARSIRGGFACVSRFFPGGRDVLAAIDEEIIRETLGPPRAGEALAFEDQSISTGAQIHGLATGRDRFHADLRPLIEPVLAARGEALGLVCHPYDLASALVAAEAGVILRAPDGSALDLPLDLTSACAWVGYANASIQAEIEPALRGALTRRGLIRDAAPP